MKLSWPSRTIGDLCDAGAAQLQTGPFGSQLHAFDYTGDGVPVVPTEAIRDRRIDHSALPMISPDKALGLQRHRLRTGDVLFARRGIQATGRIAYVRPEEEGFICGTGAIRLRVSEGVESDFLSHVLSSPKSVEWLRSHAIGATMPNLNEGIIRAFTVPIPPLEEQRTIADALNALDDKIELSHWMNHTLESIVDAIFKAWFVDFDPVRGRTEHNNAELWPKVPFSETVQVLSGGTPRTSEPEFWGGGLPWYSVADAPSDGDVFVTDTEKTISSAGVESSAAKLVPDLTTIVSARGTVGKCALTGREMAFNQSCYGLRPMDSVGYYFTYFSTRNLVEELRRSAHGSVFSTITRDTLTGVCVRRPPSDLVAAFEREVGPLMQRILLGVEQSKSLTSTRDALLPRLVSGDLAAPGVTGLQAMGGQ